MQKCWNDFYKTVLGPLELRENELHPTRCCIGKDNEHDCSIFNCHHTDWTKGVKTQAEKMWLWEDYALRHYKAPQIEGQNLDKTFGLVSGLIIFLSGLLK